MNRRHTVIALVALGAAGASPFVVAQAARTKVRVGILPAGSPEATGPLVAVFITRMRELGWIEGSTVEYVTRYAHGNPKLWRPNAAEVLAEKVDLVLAPYGPVALEAAKLTKDVPIVFCIVEDPVALGLVASLGRPGGNVTGVTTGGRELLAKRIQILMEAVPSIRRLGILQPPNAAAPALAEVAEIGRAAKQFGIETIVETIDGPPDPAQDLTAPLDRLLRQGAAATMGTIALHWGRRLHFPGYVAKARLPAIYDAEEFVDAGGLMSVSASFVDRYRAAAGYVDRILRGAKPQDLPVEQPTALITVVNLKAARALGLRLPQQLLLRADRVIE
jgi:putative ABC transport system substrate-binding protein